jgi:hypothetical protein
MTNCNLMNETSIIAALAALSLGSFAIAAPDDAKASAVFPAWGFGVINIGADAGLRVKDTVKLRSKSGEIYLGTVSEVQQSQAMVDFDARSLAVAAMAIGDPVIERPKRPGVHLPKQGVLEKTFIALNRDFGFGVYLLPSGETVIETLPKGEREPKGIR